MPELLASSSSKDFTGLRVRQAAAMLLVFGTSYFAVWTSPGGDGVSQWWVASAIGACAMVASPRSHAWWLFTGVVVLTGAGNVLGGREPISAPGLALANGVESYVIARMLTLNWSGPARLRSWLDLRRYVVVMALASVVPALMALLLSVTALDRSFSVVAAWVFINHFGCNLVLMLLVTSRPPAPAVSRTEVVAHIALMAGVTAISHAPDNTRTGAFLMTAGAVWAAARFPLRWVVLELMVLGGLITWFAQRGVGPFEVLSVDSTLVTVLGGMQSFMATSVLIGLIFATGLSLERERGLAMVAQQREVEAATVAALHLERAANRRMHSMDQAKNEMISTISHELRTPLSSIVGYVEVLQDSIDLPGHDRADMLARVSRNADRLLSLAENVLLVSAIDERVWAPDKRLIDLRDCLQAAQDAAVVPEGRSDLRVDIQVPQHPLHVHADQQEIERVILNFVSNAIKFSPGAGTVRVRLATVDAMARISVQDSGLGIGPEDQQRIFERFFRSSLARQHAVPGTGLGLSIARSIAEAHGGTTGFTSTEGKGSTFWIDLPLAVVPQP
ncbi:ATP-binding protein [Nocardioides sp.]|uniref:ATP-binding protein n=1 Tax=Nocardioides sp. TaxID=35761 RepID=UPI002C9C25DB|nr:ATP-binding protein [Nocardioides sp.]HXH79350.1 ATP-binding protein [Nocardioides sp.]